MTRRIAFIESNSGYVWGDTIDGWCKDTSAPLAAIARQMDESIERGSADGYQYDENDRGFGCPHDYYVAYEIPADLEISGDGQDREYIAAVSAGKKLGYVWREKTDAE